MISLFRLKTITLIDNSAIKLYFLTSSLTYLATVKDKGGSRVSKTPGFFRWLFNRGEGGNDGPQGLADIEKTHEKPGTSEEKLVAVLVDFDNAVLTANEAGFKISFDGLRNYCRKFGQVIFSEVFLSPRVFETFGPREFEGKTRLINALNNSGFRVVVCPLGPKDRDRVDSYVKSAGLNYAHYSGANLIIIVSEDSDFADPNFTHPVSDLGKEVIILKPSNLKSEIAEADGGGVALIPGVRRNEFLRIVDLIANDKDEDETLPEATKRAIDFVFDLIEIINHLTTPKDHEYAFVHLKNLASQQIDDNLKGVFTDDDVKTLLSVLVEEDIVRRFEKKVLGEPVFKFYRINPDHPVVKAVLEAFKD